jgi:hypothetical protein
VRSSNDVWFIFVENVTCYCPFTCGSLANTSLCHVFNYGFHLVTCQIAGLIFLIYYFEMAVCSLSDVLPWQQE